MGKYKNFFEWMDAVRRNSAAVNQPGIVSDPNGSYTGRPLDPMDKPIQDADDL